MTEIVRTEAPSFKSQRWALVPVLLLGAMLVGLGSMAAIAMDDPGFAVEPDYYRKAVAWDATRAEADHNERLGWSLRLESRDRGERWTELSLAIAAGRTPLGGASVRAEAFANARATERHALEFEEVAAGIYRARLERPRQGLWEFRIAAQRGAERYTETVRLEFGSGGDP